MNINSLAIEYGAAVYYEPEFRIIVEDHIQYLKNNTKTLNIEPVYSNKYKGDLSGLLTFYNIPTFLHWTVMRVNNYSSFADYLVDTLSLVIPDSTALERIRAIYKTKNKTVI